MNPKTNVITAGPLTPIVAVVLLGLTAFLVVTSLQLRSRTGTLTIITPATTTAISISQIDKTVALAGTGTANIRLVPGKYQITASNDGTRVTGQATVSSGKHTTLKLPAHQKSLIPSPDNINFTGMETVIANGITTDQAASTRWLFFKYWQNAQNIRISPSTVAPGPRHPDSNDPFILTFSGLIDDTPYNAKLTYTDLVNVELTLTNPQTGVVLFDQATTKSTD